MMSSNFRATELMMRIGLRGYAFDFRNSNHRQKPLKEQEQRQEREHVWA